MKKNSNDENIIDRIDGRSILERLENWSLLESEKSLNREAARNWLKTVGERKEHDCPRRVLFIHAQLPGETGSGVYLQQICRDAISKDIDMYVLAAGYHNLDSSDLSGVPDENINTCRFTREGDIPLSGAVSTPISGMSVVMPYHVLAFRDRTIKELEEYVEIFFRRISECIERLQPDVVHVDHLWFLSGLVRLAAPWIPLVVSAHGTAYKLLIDAPRFKKWVGPCVASADHVCSISPDSLEECINFFNIPREKLTIEGYGYEPELFNYNSVDRDMVLDSQGIKFPVNIDRLVLAIGKFVDWKGFKELISGIKELREKEINVGLLIVGGGDPESRADLEAYIAEQQMSDFVLLPGKLPREVLPDIYRCADVYVLSSHVEPYGLVLMEALACGTPSVSGRIGGPPDYVPSDIVDKRLTLLVDPIRLNSDGTASTANRAEYAHNLEEGILDLLQQNISMADRIAIADSVTHLSWGRLVDNLIGIYDRLVNDALKKLY